MPALKQHELRTRLQEAFARGEHPTVLVQGAVCIAAFFTEDGRLSALTADQAQLTVHLRHVRWGDGAPPELTTRRFLELWHCKPPGWTWDDLRKLADELGPTQRFTVSTFLRATWEAAKAVPGKGR